MQLSTEQFAVLTKKNRSNDPDVIRRGLVRKQNSNPCTDLYRGYRVRDIRVLFNQICNVDDWRAEVEVLSVPCELIGVVVTSIEFMTATLVTVVRDHGLYLDLHSVGYRMGRKSGRK